ncbi:MAG TPA: dTDP-glucose 4,6-dehydratase [Syntrophorhabdaceae bacterium]|nr:dTDP-glucose 4,6-dehydratase [Syntrophorhabdaceae bacterium]HOL05491.1 dTDP-glucose 4,6-dehydratase [Syntrophorhabdaceae bacterium]HON85468.1 dTDP-glucose 4,6-dehydratase [Syntrophorhabdaceae bacterium]HOT41411.1 dTDP-glucose 4,6-dehydratase [Syntrophorhabdaceae bacterium]HPC66900.1 dTDP-glucose 4,6-dehydratase [Syntrophorhabdaceae bacterium]
MDNKTILITGGCGFIGSNFVRHMLSRHPYNIINMDKLTYAGNLENLKDIENDKRYRFIKGDIADKSMLEGVFEERIDGVINFAAESHVDRSIMDPDAFIKTNINGTFQLLEMAKKKGIKNFVQISTDEVYGSLGPEGKFREDTPLSPNSPYSASKASADMLALAYHHTFNMPVVITRCSNNYGPFQFPEKLIPLIITNALADMELPVYGDGLNIRDWIHVEDHCEAIDMVFHKGRPGNVYNIGGENERTNIEIVKLILDILGKPHSLIKFVKDRPGHDRRYAIDSTKIKNELGFRIQKDFKKGMEETVRWYIENRTWWERIKSGEYIEYYDRMYKNR